METRPALKTTEFYVTALIQVIGILNLAFPLWHLSDKVSIGAMTFSQIGYAISRGLAKQGVPAPPDA